ncbi:LLM class flavin-dependent oxidoreductase [Conexibacter stalactiti]|uniref:LLM class flavin-dependent oxidoreductase n=1 Tax=Conexibacter stalactiti TaxID=1940611 RepID=A0ABU4HWE4_9ACTN|nr:LLM class flavin-dependent oxidoreductase [Conexibacter stalactiti]MDW5597623.1 LLM class flavin-dependent oxidoreductase [Conexibacter stalactiti]MEC5038265.1 LLM class flavin-dependent oxidoreductase [Conexibacter stalactiti]
MIALNFYVPCNLGSTPGAEHHEVYRQNVELAKFAAAELGVSTFDIPEHHFVDMLNVPGPFVMAAHLAAQIENVKVRTTVAPIVLHDNLLRFAGEAALADNLTEGRVEIGLSRGSIDYEARRLGGTMARSRDRFQEGVLFLERLFGERDVTADGEFYKVPEATTIMPRTYKERRIPIWLGSTSRDSIRWAASHGFNVVTTSLREPVELLRKQAQWFHEAADELPDTVERPRVDVLTQVFVSEDEGEILRIKERIVEKQVAQMRGLLVGAPRFIDGKMVNQGGGDEVTLSVEDIEESVLIGTPEEVLEGIQLREQLGYNGVSLDLFYHDPGFDSVMGSLELFRDKVLPGLRGTQADLPQPASR